eukprot:5225873-Pleurochrysis_carterae.AAC.1
MVRRQGQSPFALLVITTNIPTQTAPLASLAAETFPQSLARHGGAKQESHSCIAAASTLTYKTLISVDNANFEVFVTPFRYYLYLRVTSIT